MIPLVAVCIIRYPSDLSFSLQRDNVDMILQQNQILSFSDISLVIQKVRVIQREIWGMSTTICGQSLSNGGGW
jgi:hypothetical protein